MTAPTTSLAAYSDSDAEYAEALEAARLSPALYALLVHGLRPARHHLEWLTALRETVDTPGGRLLLIAPPGSGKSSYISHVLPAWYLGNHPARSVLATTSSDVMAGEFGGVLAITLRQNEAHRAVFPDPRCRPDPARGWSQDGLYLAGADPAAKDPSYKISGFGSSVIGSRCDLLLLDDVTTQDVAQSEAEMRRARRYLDLTLLTRLQPGGSAVAICTRWGEDDLAAHLLQQGWRTLLYPQLSAQYPDVPGTPQERDAEGRAPLWPARFPLEWVQQERTRLGTAQFELVHQGSPLLMGGNVYRSATWFRNLPDSFVPEIAPRAVRMMYVDTAFSEQTAADFTCAVTVAYDPRDPQRRLYVVGLFRKQINEDGLAAALAEHILIQKPDAVGVELPAFRQEATQGMLLELGQHLYGRHAVEVKAIRVSTDKTVRARLPAARGEAGLLYVDKALPEWPTAERELLGFPISRHDDVSDALAGATVMALGPVGQQVSERPQKVRFG